MAASPGRIFQLATRRDLIPQVALLLAATWPDYYGDAGPGFALHDACERTRLDGMPMAIIAVDDCDRLLGSGTLAGLSHGAQPGEAPWIIGLCVAPAMRGRGIGSDIVEALCQIAQVRGHTDIYATTIAAEGMLRRRGFQHLRAVTDDSGNWRVMRRVLT